MAKFYIKCPNCGKYHLASSGLFAKKVISCDCGYQINVKTDRMASRKCPKCSNVVVYDQAKRNEVECPVCHSHLNPFAGTNIVSVHCPTCNISLEVDRGASVYTCPVCDTEFDVQKQILKEKASKSDKITIVKYEGPKDVIVYKYPIEDFITGSELIVHESQTAIFLKDGEALDSFGPGRHFLTTDRLPLVGKTYHLETNQDAQTFHCEIYFINCSTIRGIKWGTPSKISLFDPHSGLHVDIGACGQFNLVVKEPRKLLTKMVGTESELRNSDIIGDCISKDDFSGRFKTFVITKVKSFLAKTIREENINVLELDEHLDDLSVKLRDLINPGMEEYGLSLSEFFISGFLLPDDDPNFRKRKEQYAEQYLKVKNENILRDEARARQQRRMVEVQTQANEQLRMAQAKAQAYRLQAQAEADERKRKGYSYQDETRRQVSLGAVNNPGIGNISSTASTRIDLGIGLGARKEVAQNVGQTIKDVSVSTPSSPLPPETDSDTGWECPSCHRKGIKTNFCPNCGTKKPEEGWECPNCHRKGIKSNFCPNCGTKKPEIGWECPNCHTKGITTNFCPNCGTKKEG